MLYSVKMRSSRGGVHGKGGRHISGAERIVSCESVEKEVLAMVRRAQTHDRGSPDFIQLKMEVVKPGKIVYVPLLPVSERKTATKEEGRKEAEKALTAAGVTEKAVKSGISFLTHLQDSLRGAVIIDAETGERVDGKGSSGHPCFLCRPLFLLFPLSSMRKQEKEWTAKEAGVSAAAIWMQKIRQIMSVK